MKFPLLTAKYLNKSKICLLAHQKKPRKKAKRCVHFASTFAAAGREFYNLSIRHKHDRVPKAGFPGALLDAHLWCFAFLC